MLKILVFFSKRWKESITKWVIRVTIRSLMAFEVDGLLSFESFVVEFWFHLVYIEIFDLREMGRGGGGSKGFRVVVNVLSTFCVFER